MQRLRQYVNMIVVPVILLNALSAAVAALSLMQLGNEFYLALTVSTTVFNLVAAILVAIQKFFQYEEKVRRPRSLQLSPVPQSLYSLGTLAS